MKKNIFVWSLYDFANSIIMIVFLFYFSQWLVIDSGKSDWWYNGTLIVSSLLFIILAPILSKRLDISGAKLAGVRITTVVMTLFYLATTIVMLFFPTQALLATIFFTLAMTFYLLSFLYYTPMLSDISDDTNRGWVSGLGMGANYIGQVFGLLVTLPFATGAIYLFGSHGRPQTLLPAVILFALSAAPLMFIYKETNKVSVNDSNVNTLPVIYPKISQEYKEALIILKKVFSIRNLALIMIGYFLFSDALLTFSNNFPIFLEKVFSADDTVKTYLTAGILLLSGIGSLIFGKISDKKGKKKTLLFILMCWVILFAALALSHSFIMAAIVCLVAGLFFGPVWGISRSMVSEYSPKEIEASSFGIYTVAERFSPFIGPVVWSIILASTKGQGVISYSYAIAGMGILVFISIFFILKIKSQPTTNI